MGQPTRWDEFFRTRSHGKILSWPLGCVLSRIFERVTHLFWSANSFQHAQLAIFIPVGGMGCSYGTVGWCGANLSGPVAGISVALYRDPTERASSPPHMDGTVFFVWIIGVQPDLAQAGHPTYRAHMNRPLGPVHMEVSQPGKRAGPFWRDLATSLFFI